MPEILPYDPNRNFYTVLTPVDTLVAAMSATVDELDAWADVTYLRQRVPREVGQISLHCFGVEYGDGMTSFTCLDKAEELWYVYAVPGIGVATLQQVEGRG